MLRTIFKRFLAVCVILAVLCAACCLPVSAEQTEYTKYLTARDKEYFSDNTVASADLSATVGEYERLALGIPQAEAVVFDSTVSFNVQIEKDGYYNIRLCYMILSANAEQAEYKLLIDGALPFAEVAAFGLNTEYVRVNEEILTDNLGNQLTPELKTSDNWISAFLRDDSGYQNEPYQFYLTAGTHQITLSVTDGKVALCAAEFIGVRKTPTYKQYLAENKDKTAGQSGYSMVYEAENPVARSSQAVIESSDNSTASVSPVSGRLTVLNNIGGQSWSIPRQSASWKIEVPTSGLYTVSLRYRQNFTNGIYTTRRIYIDGEIPFAELASTNFPYCTEWTDLTLGEGKEPYLIYLEAGEHILTAESSLGSMSEIVTAANEIILQLNGIYRNIISITSSSPDSYRDYDLDKKIPSAIEEMGVAAEKLQKLSDRLIELVGKDVSETSLLDRMIIQLEEFCEKPRIIPSKLSQFQSNISSLGTWVYERYEQPLSLDMIGVAAPDAEIAFADASFFEQIAYTLKQFMYSFSDDYALAKEQEDKKTVVVWTSVGRDQYQIINQLTEESFNTQSKSYRAQVRLISGAALMPAVVAGRGPDVVPSIDGGTPINYAIRGAAYDLSVFDNFGEIEKRFHGSALTPFRMGDSVYALPVTMTFPVLFYRTDILGELGIEVPKTWKDVTKTMIQLSQNQMQFGFAPSMTSYATMLYQNGGSFYDDGQYCNLDGETELSTFADYTSLYSEYGFTVSFDFANRFRSGEMPIGIVDYTTFNMLEVFAPEIKGLWDIALVPGTETENGIDNTVAGDVSATMIIGDTRVAEGAWEYISWWTSSDIQTRYGQAIENKLGASARYSTANLEALSQMPWSSGFYRVLSDQLSKTRTIPEVAGGYFTSRHFTNAFRAVVYRDEDPIESLREYTKTINLEIERKRTELRLDEQG